MTSHLIYKQPDAPDKPDTYRLPGWHRDYAMAMHDGPWSHSSPARQVRLTDLSEKGRGVTMVSPGSNLLTDNPEIPAGQVDPENAVEPELQPGDCLIFENRTFSRWRAAPGRYDAQSDYGRLWISLGHALMDYVKQDAEFVQTLSPLQRFLVGEPFDDVETFQVNGGRNPIAEWCDEHGLPKARHPQVQG